MNFYGEISHCIVSSFKLTSHKQNLNQNNLLFSFPFSFPLFSEAVSGVLALKSCENLNISRDPFSLFVKDFKAYLHCIVVSVPLICQVI